MMWADEVERPVDVNHIQLKTNAANEHEYCVDMLRQYGKQTAQKHHHSDAQWNIHHTLQKQWETAAQSVFKVDADKGTHDKYKQNKPQR